MIGEIYLLMFSLICGASASDYAELSPRGDCTEVMANSYGYPLSDGRYQLIVGAGRRSIYAYCDMTTDGGGWTVFQKRTSGALNFYQNWASYENGFGNVNGDHWLGLKYLHSITAGKRYILRIEYTDWNDVKHYAEYDDFKIGGAGCSYRLDSLGNYCGDCGDSLKPTHLGMKFTTYDRDNDNWSANCAFTFKGAWWYNACHTSNLNGEYKNGGSHTDSGTGMDWNTCGGLIYSYKTTKMMIRDYYF